jgi:hypothetical protein
MLDAKRAYHCSTRIRAALTYSVAAVCLLFNYAKSLALTNPAAEQREVRAASAGARSGVRVNYSAGGHSSVAPGANAGAGVQRGVGRRTCSSKVDT